jgi:hypothetical protein
VLVCAGAKSIDDIHNNKELMKYVTADTPRSIHNNPCGYVTALASDKSLLRFVSPTRDFVQRSPNGDKLSAVFVKEADRVRVRMKPGFTAALGECEAARVKCISTAFASLCVCARAQASRNVVYCHMSVYARAQASMNVDIVTCLCNVQQKWRCACLFRHL